MEYRIERYKNCERFNEQYPSIYQFLLEAEKLEYSVPDVYTMSPQGFVADPWQYQLVIHKGFDNEGIPEKWGDESLKRLKHIPHINEDLKTFAISNNEYCAHCSLWTQRVTQPISNRLQLSPTTEN